MLARSTVARCLLCFAVLLLAGPVARQAAAQAFVGLQVLPEQPTVHDPLRITVSEFSGFDPDFALSVDEPSLVVEGTYSNFGGVPIGESLWTETFTVRPFPAGIYNFEFRFAVGASTRVYRQTVTVLPPVPTLLLHSGRFRVRVDWKNPYGPGSGQGFARVLTDQSGAFWFFAPANLEVTIKILDGRAVNGHFWVFISNLSTVEFTVTVENCPPVQVIPICTQRHYHNPPFANRNFIDTAAFQ